MRDLFPSFEKLSLASRSARSWPAGVRAGGAGRQAAGEEFLAVRPALRRRSAALRVGAGQISSRFAEKESRFWNSTLQITGYDRVHEIAFRPWQSDNIPRRYCAATAMISDGKPRPVYFSIIEDGGFASFSHGVEFCVVGLDRNWAYNPACKAARP